MTPTTNKIPRWVKEYIESPEGKKALKEGLESYNKGEPTKPLSQILKELGK